VNNYNIQKSYLSWLGENGPFDFSCKIFFTKLCYERISTKKVVKHIGTAPMSKTSYSPTYILLSSVMFVTVQTLFLKHQPANLNYLY
jgi:hypothetical protein